MARYGFCPSGRLFEAAACGVPLLSDFFEGLETFFRLGSELICVRSADDVLEALSLSDGSCVESPRRRENEYWRSIRPRGASRSSR